MIESDDIPDAEIYVPWNGFNCLYNEICVQDKEILSKADSLIKEIHPAYDKLSRGAKALHTRNCFQVLGRNLDTPSTLFLCWCKLDSKGQPLGGTRTAIKIAEKIGLKVTNLFVQDDLDRVLKYLDK